MILRARRDGWRPTAGFTGTMPVPPSIRRNGRCEPRVLCKYGNRSTIYKSGIGRWRAYEEFLGPMTKTLADKAPSR
jgi:hypothetical protein